MEDLSFIRGRLNYGKYMNRRLHSWAFARLQGRIEDKTLDAGIPVREACVYVQDVPRLRSYQTARVASRVPVYKRRLPRIGVSSGYYHGGEHRRSRKPMGESVPWKSERDDSPQDRSCSAAVTVHRKTSAKLAQMTLSAYSG